MTRKQYVWFIHRLAEELNEKYKAEGLRDRVIIDEGFKLCRLKFVESKKLNDMKSRKTKQNVSKFY